MTPKEKAQQLMQKMDVIHYLKLGGRNKDSKGLPVSMYNDQIKQCALNAVDEIINSFNLNTGTDIVGNAVIKFAIREGDYWEQVKKEIQQL